MKERKILPPTYVFLSVVSIIGLHFLIPVTKVVPSPWNLTGLLPLVMGIIVNIIAANAFEKANTTIKPYQASTYLVTNGLYRVSRNPMYLGATLILVGTVVMLGSLTPYLVIIVFVVLINEVFIKTEEHMLEGKFSERYLAYKQKVRRWI
jgi:protein-S-isoprenylcysteine O-methyltransferase Ste14